MPNPINTLTFIKRLLRSYSPSRPVLNTLMIKKVNHLYELNLAGKPILFKQDTYDTLKRIVEDTTELLELKESSSERASYCLIPVTMYTLASLKSFVIIKSRKHIIDTLLPTL